MNAIAEPDGRPEYERRLATMNPHERLLHQLDRLPDSDAVVVAKDDLRVLLADVEDLRGMRQRALQAYLISDYRGCAYLILGCPDTTELAALTDTIEEIHP